MKTENETETETGNEFRVLGTLEVRLHGHDLPIPGTRQRALLAMLLLHPNETVSTDRLIDALWGDEPPESGVSALQVRVSQLRKVLDDGRGGNGSGPLKTHPSGYALEVGPDALDLLAFDRLCAEGMDALNGGEAEGASDLLGQALALWRGPALADLVAEPFARSELPRLNERRLRALEARNDAELSLGHHASLIADLTAEVEAEPLREHLCAQLVTALYRSGRQAEALDVVRGTRDRLAEELGIEPGEELSSLEVAILRHDPSLEAPVVERRPAASGPPPAPQRGIRRRALLIAGVAFALVAATVVWRTERRPDGIALATLGSAAIGAIDTGDGVVTSALRVPEAPSSMVGAYGSLWTTNYQANTVSEIDPATGTVHQAAIPVGAGPRGIVAGDGALWVANTLDGTVSKIDPAQDQVLDKISVSPRPGGIAFGEGHVWVVDALSGRLMGIDPSTDRIVKRYQVDAGGDAIAVGGGRIWVATSTRYLVGIVPGTGFQTDSVQVEQPASSVVYAGGKVWVADALGSAVMRVDPERDEVDRTIDLGGSPLDLVVDAGTVWVANALGGSVSEIDQTSGDLHTFRVGDQPEAIASVGGRVWVGVNAVDPAHRGGTLRLRSVVPVRSLDPADAFLAQDAWQASDVLQMTNDGLVAFSRATGSNGTQLVADLATTLPNPTDNGRRYTFHVRTGIRYSTGATVTASDIKNALERDFAPDAKDVGPIYYSEIVGSRACGAHPGACDLGGVQVNKAEDTISFQLRRADPDFLYRLALSPAFAVPRGVDPPSKHDLTRVPATGPYLIDSVTSDALVMERNPFFHEWSADAQPDGYPDRIVWTFGASADESATSVEQGTADWTFDRPRDPSLARLLIDARGQVHGDPSLETAFVSMDVTKPPFNDVRVRRALDMAVDRAKLIRILGGNVAGTPTCKLLPPLMSGYRPDCRYPLAGSPVDVKQAQRLVESAGAKGDRVTLGGGTVDQIGSEPLSEYIGGVLQEIGLRPHFVQDPDAVDTISFYSWAADYPSASNFFGPLFSCPTSAPTNDEISTGFCDRQLHSLMDEALRDETNQRPQAAATSWANIDRRLAKEAAVIPLFNPNEIDFVSARVGNFRSNPELGPLLDQMWVR